MAELVAALAGLLIGALGTLIGAGGGFILAPLLLIVEPGWSTEVVTAFSIAVVTANAGAGAVSYLRMRRIDVRSFPIFALAATPGAIAGAIVAAWIPRALFDLIFGAVLVAVGIWLIARPTLRPARAARAHHVRRQLVDAAGTTYTWSFDMRMGVANAALVGFLSSLMGIGGGIVHVPVLVTVLAFPEHVATATSHAVLAVTALISTAVHLIRGDYASDAPLVLAASAGAIVGAPIGARLSRQIPGHVLLRLLGASLTSVGLRLLTLSH
jgi:uncharacterized protein